MFFDTVHDETLVLDFGVSEITAICRDRDGDGLCDADDPCTGAATVDQPKLAITKLATPPGDDKLAFKGQMTLPFPFSPALDPGSRGARVLLEGTAGALLDVTIPHALVAVKLAAEEDFLVHARSRFGQPTRDVLVTAL